MRTTEQNHTQRPDAIRVFILAVALNLAIPFVGSTTTTSAAEPETPLFSFVESGKAEAMKSGGGERLVKVNVGALSGRASRKLRMPLLGGEMHEAARTDFEQRGPGDFTWRGKITNPGDVTLTVKNGVVSGLIYAESGVYEVKPTSGPEHRLARVDFSGFGESGVVPSSTAENVPDQLRAGGSSVTADSAAFIEVLIVYTPAARRQAGGTAQIQALAQSAVDVANTAYANSGITTRLRLAPIQEVNYAESGNSHTDLTWLQSDPTVAALRDQFGGDVVSMFCSWFADIDSMSYRMIRVDANFAPHAFGVVRMESAVADLTFARALGFNQGCDDDHIVAGAQVSYPYAHGFYKKTPGFYTIMSNRPAGCDSCFRVPNFSNPNVKFRDFRTGRRYSMGVAGSSENYRVINDTAATVANFRQGTFRLGGDPTDLWATQVSLTRVDLTWRNNAFPDCYFEVERSVAGGPFELIRQTWLNQTTFSDLDVTPGQNYVYRVRAATDDWVLYTDYSNDARPVPGCIVSDMEAAPIAPEETASGTLDETDCFTSVWWTGGRSLADRYTFEGVADQLVVISASSPDFALLLVLFDSEGRNIGSDSDHDPTQRISRARVPGLGGGIRLPHTGTYFIELASYDHGAAGDYTVTLASGDPATAIPETPSDLVVTAVTSDTVELQWTDNAAFETGFEIWGGFNLDMDEVDLDVDPDTTTATITGLTPGSTYFFAVRSFNTHGNSRFTEPVTVTTDP
jgi:peptidyl-Asp metalloendopeptidase